MADRLTTAAEQRDGRRDGQGLRTHTGVRLPVSKSQVHHRPAHYGPWASHWLLSASSPVCKVTTVLLMEGMLLTALARPKWVVHVSHCHPHRPWQWMGRRGSDRCPRRSTGHPVGAPIRQGKCPGSLYPPGSLPHAPTGRAEVQGAYPPQVSSAHVRGNPGLFGL